MYCFHFNFVSFPWSFGFMFAISIPVTLQSRLFIVIQILANEMFHNKSKSKSNIKPKYTEVIKTIETCSNLNNKDEKMSQSVSWDTI